MPKPIHDRKKSEAKPITIIGMESGDSRKVVIAVAQPDWERER